MEYFKNISLLFLLLHGINSIGQIIDTNLVNNSSFEEYYSCPAGTDELYKCKYWWGLSADYYNSCSGSMGVPSNFAGFQYAHTGNAYAGYIIYSYNYIYPNIDYREALKTKLKDSLIANKRYCTNFYISLTEYSYNSAFNCIVLDSIGMLFTKDSVQDSVVSILSNGIRVQNDIFNIDTVNWLQISNSFIANGGEQYLTIGNFDNVITYPSSAISATYVYIDDVSVCECSFKFNLGNDTTLCVGESLILNPNMPNATYTWPNGSHASTYNVTQAGTYWVQAYFADYNITTTDTINIMYKDCEDTLVIPNIFTPNGDGVNDYFVIKNAKDWNINLQVFNRWGNDVYKADNYQNNWDGKNKGNPLADGVYFYIINAKGLFSGREKEYKGSLTIMR